MKDSKSANPHPPHGTLTCGTLTYFLLLASDFLLLVNYSQKKTANGARARNPSLYFFFFLPIPAILPDLSTGPWRIPWLHLSCRPPQ